MINASGGLCINNACQTSWPSGGGSGATLGANTFSATQTIGSGNLALPISASAASGVITLGGSPFLHNYGNSNTFLGTDAGNFTTTGSFMPPPAAGRSSPTPPILKHGDGALRRSEQQRRIRQHRHRSQHASSRTPWGREHGDGHATLYSNSTGQ